MTTPAHDMHPAHAAQTTTTRRRRRTVALTAVTVSAFVTMAAVVDTDPSTDTEPTEIAFGSTWS